MSLAALATIPVRAFVANPPSRTPSSVFSLHASSINQDGASSSSNDGVISIDVSDLGLTMSDLEQKIPIHNFSIESSGYQSTSRIPDVNDDGCYWVENPEDIDVTLRIPGL